MSRSASYPAKTPNVFPLEAWRSRVALSGVMLGMAALSLWAIKVQLVDNDFLERKGAERYSRLLEIPAPRGKIYDRNGVVLASNIPARAIWASPKDVVITPAQVNKLATILEIPAADINEKLARKKMGFVYLRRQVTQEIADQIKALKIVGVDSQKETRRSYPQAEVFAHMIGFIDIEGKGQEGLEKTRDKDIQGEAGARQVIKDRLGNVIEDEGVMREAHPGSDVYLSLDSRIQYVVYDALRDAVNSHNAKSASAIVVDTQTGEILAMENYPSFDPNNRANMNIDALSNRAVTDAFEPGSALKPFTIAFGLDKGKITPNSTIETGNGQWTIGDYTIGDHVSGRIGIADIIKRSSNIGTGKVAMMFSREQMWGMFDSVGFGKKYEMGFPEKSVTAGLLRPADKWQKVEQVTMSYGQGIAMSLLQLTHAYTVFARDGELIDLTFIKRDTPDAVSGTRIFGVDAAREVRQMMQGATEKGGTGQKAQVRGYTVSGKTGTAYKPENGSYNKNKYIATFAGIAPASAPRIVVTVMVDNPSTNGHMGGDVAAPVFSTIVSETLRIMSVSPDAPYKTSIDYDQIEETM